MQHATPTRKDEPDDTAPQSERRPRQMLIDRHMPEFDRSMSWHIVVDAPPDATYAAVADLDFADMRSPVLRALLAIRMSRWNRIRRKRGLPALELPERLTLDTMSRFGRVRLAEEPGTEIVIGALEKRGEEPRDFGAAEFVGFAEPGYVKGAAEFSVRSFGVDRSLLSYEARLRATDPVARRWVDRWMRVMAPLTRRVVGRMLQHIKADAERRASRSAAA